MTSIPAPRSDPIGVYHEIDGDAGGIFKRIAPDDLPVQLSKTVELTINLNVAAMPPVHGEIRLPQFIRSPE
jgi:hypothetical protein